VEFQLLLKGANVITLDDRSPEAQAIGIGKDGRINWVGKDAEIPLQAAGDAAALDLHGATVLPGFIDTHVHLLATGIYELLGIDCSAYRSIEEILEGVYRKAEEAGKGNWVLGHHFDQMKVKENRYPHIEELTRVAPENPVCIWRSDSHSAAMNRKAAESLQIYPGQPGADVDEDGNFTGVVRGLANSKAAREIYSVLIKDGVCERAYHAACLQALRVGITTIGALIGGVQTELSTTWLLQNMESLPVRTVVFDQTLDIQKVKDRGLTRIGGCLLIDGSLGSHTAALYEPYSDLPESTGILYWKDEDLNRFIRQAHEAGLQIGVHAIGERAIDQVLNAYENSLGKSPRANHRHRIEHFLVPTPEAILRAIDLGLVLAMQPAFEYFWGGPNNLYESRLGSERARRVNPIGSILKTGGRIAGGSDSFVTPMDPLLGIHSAVNHPNEDERITVSQAIDLFTRSAAYATFDEKEKGSIQEGYLGDLVVLAEDPREVRAETIKDIQVFMTVVGGKVVFRRE